MRTHTLAHFVVKYRAETHAALVETLVVCGAHHTSTFETPHKKKEKEKRQSNPVIDQNTAWLSPQRLYRTILRFKPCCRCLLVIVIVSDARLRCTHKINKFPARAVVRAHLITHDKPTKDKQKQKTARIDTHKLDIIPL